MARSHAAPSVVTFPAVRANTHAGTDERSRRRAALMAAAQQGDAASYGELMNDVGPMIMGVLRRRLRDPEECRDAYQDVLMAVHRSRHTYEPGRPLEPWLLAIARYVVIHRTRRGSARHVHEVLVDAAPEAGAPSDQATRLDLEQALRALSPDQREAIRLLHVDGLPLDAAAQRAGTTTGALKVRAHRAYKTLRRLLLTS